MCIVYLLAGVLFIFLIKLQPKSDPAKVLNVAEQLLVGGHSSFTDPEGYMFRYPFQNGILLLDVGLLCLFGNGAYLAFQVLNLFAAIGISDAIGRISETILCHKNGGGLDTNCDITSAGAFPVHYLYVWDTAFLSLYSVRGIF